jgi:anaerobic selenocysteine-containing dehydrogenase
MTQEVRSFCRLCNAMCGIVVHVDGDRVVKVAGDPDHPFSEGYTCPKGRALPAVHHDPARLDEPLVRDASGGLAPRTWDEVLDDLAARLTAIIDRHGPDAVAVYRATHWAFDTTGRAWSDRFFANLPTRQQYSAVTLDAPNKTLVPDIVAGAPFLFPVVDWETTRLLVIVGQNTVVSHGHAVARPNALVALRRIQERGGTVVVADPRTTETARLADLHLPLRPGSDPAFLAYLVRHVLRGRADEEFLDQCADPESVQRLREAVEPYDLERTAAECGLAFPALLRTAELVGAGRLSIQTGTGISMGPAPNVGEWLSWALAAVTGSLDRPGGVLFNPGFLRPQEERLTVRPRHSGPGPASRPELAAAYGERPASALPDEIESGAIRALFVLGGNPITALPGSARTTRALRSLDLLAVCDIRHTETTDLAGYLLPVAGQLERADVTSFLDLAFPKPFVQYGPPAVACPPGRWPMWRVFAALGERLGLVGFAGASARTDDEVLAGAATRARMPWQQIRSARSGVEAPDAPGPGWLIPGRLPRPLDLAPAEMVDQFRAYRPPVGPLLLVNGRRLRQANSVLRDGHKSPTLVLHPGDAARHHMTAGQRVTIRSEHGATTAEIEISESIRAGAVWLPHGWTEPEVNSLTSGTSDVEPLTGMPRFGSVPVTLEHPV